MEPSSKRSHVAAGSASPGPRPWSLSLLLSHPFAAPFIYRVSQSTRALATLSASPCTNMHGECDRRLPPLRLRAAPLLPFFLCSSFFVSTSIPLLWLDDPSRGPHPTRVCDESWWMLLLVGPMRRGSVIFAAPSPAAAAPSPSAAASICYQLDSPSRQELTVLYYTYTQVPFHPFSSLCDHDYDRLGDEAA